MSKVLLVVLFLQTGESPSGYERTYEMESMAVCQASLKAAVSQTQRADGQRAIGMFATCVNALGTAGWPRPPVQK